MTPFRVAIRLISIVGLVALFGCQGAGTSFSQDPASYPARLSLGVKKNLERYRDEPYPLAFVIAKDGGFSTFWRCNGPNCNGSDSSYIAAAKKSCRQFGHKGECLVHSVKNRKVWPVQEAFATEVRSQLTVPWRYENAGAVEAEGVILYVPGYGGHRFPPALNHERVPTYLRSMNARGYDILRLNIAHYDMMIQNDAEINDKIAQTIVDLKQQGYRKVFLAGQSRGSWQLLGTMKKELAIDGAILMVPAAHGRAESWDGSENTRFGQSESDFRRLIAGLGRYPLFIGFFEGDPYDPGGRQRALATFHADRIGKSIFVLDQPSDLAGHGAAWQTAFAVAYQDCLTDFLALGRVRLGNCERTLDGADERHVATRQHIIDRGGERMVEFDLEIFAMGRAFHPIRGNPGWWGMLTRRNGTMLHWFPGSYLSGNTHESEWAVDDDKLCVIDSQRHNSNEYCLELWKLPSGNVGLVTPDGLAFVVSAPAAKSVKELDFTPGDWKGEKNS